MNKYRVTLKEIEIYEIEVVAEDGYSAINEAWETLMNAPDKGIYHNDSDGESDVEEL